MIKNLGILKMHIFQRPVAFHKKARERVYTFRYNSGYTYTLVKLVLKFCMHVLCMKVSALSKINRSHEVTVAPVALLRIHTAEDTAIVS